MLAPAPVAAAHAPPSPSAVGIDPFAEAELLGDLTGESTADAAMKSKGLNTMTW